MRELTRPTYRGLHDDAVSTPFISGMRMSQIINPRDTTQNDPGCVRLARIGTTFLIYLREFAGRIAIINNLDSGSIM